MQHAGQTNICAQVHPIKLRAAKTEATVRGRRGESGGSPDCTNRGKPLLFGSAKVREEEMPLVAQSCSLLSPLVTTSSFYQEELSYRDPL